NPPGSYTAARSSSARSSADDDKAFARPGKEAPKDASCNDYNGSLGTRAMKNDYDVGYCKPPKATRFVKGRSGNPHGRPPRCLLEGRPVRFDDILMKELDAPITVTEGGQPKKISKQRAAIKTLVNGAIKGNTRAIANLFKLTRTHHVNLNDDCEVIHILAERMEFVGELFDETSTSPLTSGLSPEQQVRYMEEFLRDGVFYLTGKLRLGRDHPINLQPRPKRRPSASFADDL